MLPYYDVLEQKICTIASSALISLSLPFSTLSLISKYQRSKLLVIFVYEREIHLTHNFSDVFRW